MLLKGQNIIKSSSHPKVKKKCDEVAKELNEKGVPWIAYDIMGDSLSEVNLTCPGLLRK